MEYNTIQKKLLIDFMRKNHNRSFTIDEIASEISVGKSTIYRLMPKLIDDGTVKRFTKGTTRVFLYQYVNCKECSCHLHMKCTDCGKILHMDNTYTDKLLSNIMCDSSFSVDKNRTILFGKCSNCIKETNIQRSESL